MADSPFWLDGDDCRTTLRKRLAAPPPTRIQLHTGPRQAGKTTLLLNLAGSSLQLAAGLFILGVPSDPSPPIKRNPAALD